MRKLTNISNEFERGLTPSGWSAVCNALGGVWGWTETSLLGSNDSWATCEKIASVSWRVDPYKAEAHGVLEEAGGVYFGKWSEVAVALPFCAPSGNALAADGEVKATTTRHRGGAVQVVSSGAWAVSQIAENATQAALSGADGALWEIKLFLNGGRK